jgi:hypothetical protein
VGLTLEKSIEYHRELWNWLAENPASYKEDWPGWEQVIKEYPELATRGEIVDSHCFACYVVNRFTFGGCSDCVLDWPGEDCCNDNPGDGEGLFFRWDDAKTTETRKKLAMQIRDLPVRGLMEEGGQDYE